MKHPAKIWRRVFGVAYAKAAGRARSKISSVPVRDCETLECYLGADMALDELRLPIENPEGSGPRAAWGSRSDKIEDIFWHVARSVGFQAGGSLILTTVTGRIVVDKQTWERMYTVVINLRSLNQF